MDQEAARQPNAAGQGAAEAPANQEPGRDDRRLRLLASEAAALATAARRRPPQPLATAAYPVLPPQPLSLGLA